jgi:hypothetical protein
MVRFAFIWYSNPPQSLVMSFLSHISEKGHKEAKAAGVLLKAEGIHFDIAFTSFLSRAVRTCWYALEETNQMHVPVHTSWRLNERCIILPCFFSPCQLFTQPFSLRYMYVYVPFYSPAYDQTLWSASRTRQTADGRRVRTRTSERVASLIRCSPS